MCDAMYHVEDREIRKLSEKSNINEILMEYLSEVLSLIEMILEIGFNYFVVELSSNLLKRALYIAASISRETIHST